MTMNICKRTTKRYKTITETPNKYKERKQPQVQKNYDKET